jgi:hypothetical protein
MAMMIPDYALVAEVMLFSEGFEDSKVWCTLLREGNFGGKDWGAVTLPHVPAPHACADAEP